MFPEIEQLQEAITAVLMLDPDTLTDDELHESVVVLHRQTHRLAGARARLVARWDRCQVWADDGSRSAAHRLARDSRTSVATARRELRRARHLESMPHTAAAVAAGELSAEHVDLLGAANDGCRRAVFAEHEAMLVEQCTMLRFEQAGRAVKYWRHRADTQAGEDDAQRLHTGRSASVAVTIDGMVDLRAWLDPLGGAAVKAELDRLEHELYLRDQRDGRLRTTSQRRADAVVEMATRSATAPAKGRRPKPLFTVLLGDETFTRLCESSTGQVLTPGQLVPHLTTAQLERVLFDGPTTVISVSKRRTFTGALRRAIQVRDRHCQHPAGCDVAADDCDVDHTVPYTHGGATSQFNGRLQCPPQNRHADKHDHDAIPLPLRPVTRLDELRALIRWRNRHYYPDDQTDDPDDDPQVA
jgi:5-methylcytosine-specific restriction endonuclease McrA